MSNKNLINQLITGNNIYNSYRDRYEYLYNSYVGGQAYKDQNYLTRYVNETDKEYQARIDTTPLDNHCKSVISVYNSFLFRDEPERDLEDLEIYPEVEDFLKDADLEGRSLNHFMKEVNIWSCVFGHCWIMVSKPNLGLASRGQEQALGVRPYVSLLTPLTVLDWTWERNAIGRYELSYLKYIEDINGDIQVIKEYTNELIKTTQVDVSKTDIVYEEVAANELGRIPAIIAYADRSQIRGIGVSQIDDIADIQRFIYNVTSEAEQSIRLDSHPSLVVTADVQVGAGAGSIITIPENLPADVKPYVLEFTGASIDSIYTVIDKSIGSIEKMANIGGIRATESRTLSGVALETEFQLLNAKLASLADNLELAEEQMWDIFCQYQSIPKVKSIDYPGAFNIKNTSNELADLKTASEITDDPRVKAGIAAKVLDELEIDADEALMMQNPNMIAEAEGVEEVKFEPKELINPIDGAKITPTTAQEELQLIRQGYTYVD